MACQGLPSCKFNNELSLSLYVDLSLNGLDALYFCKGRVAWLIEVDLPGKGDESIYRICRRVVCGLDANHCLHFKCNLG